MTFANFQNTCGKDFAITTEPNVDDAIHPALISQTTLYNVGSQNNFYLHRPRLGYVKIKVIIFAYAEHIQLEYLYKELGLEIFMSKLCFAKIFKSHLF